jgi:hypothetical protein
MEDNEDNNHGKLSLVKQNMIKENDIRKHVLSSEIPLY